MERVPAATHSPAHYNATCGSTRRATQVAAAGSGGPRAHPRLHRGTLLHPGTLLLIVSAKLLESVSCASSAVQLCALLQRPGWPASESTQPTVQREWEEKWPALCRRWATSVRCVLAAHSGACDAQLATCVEMCLIAGDGALAGCCCGGGAGRAPAAPRGGQQDQASRGGAGGLRRWAARLWGELRAGVCLCVYGLS